ncbi:tetratricopeptide repeat containing protein [Pseudohyphozyma bogoriensis]|nr:tetratricopeptide repeat containing protein [Pseudohyphozyma bogoriensis]
MLISACLARGEARTSATVTAQAALTEVTLHSLLPKPSFPSSSSPTIPSSPPTHPTIPTASRSSALTSLDLLRTALSSSTNASPVDKNSAEIVRGWGLYCVAEFAEAVEVLKGCEKEAPNGGGWEGYDLTLRVLANLVEGDAHSELGNSGAALAAYKSAARVYDDAYDILTRSGGTKDDVRLRDVGERAMYAYCIASRGGEPLNSMVAHRLYLKHSSRWSPSFRTTRTLTIHNSFRSLLHASGPSKSAPEEWHADAARNNSAQEVLVRATTKLPPAGEVNAVYLAFLDSVAEGWRIGGAGRAGAAEVVEIMYNALTHTFQSQRLLRHLIHALTAKGAYEEAGKALHLYTELANKTRETDAAQVAKDARKFRQKTQAAEKGEAQGKRLELDFEKEKEAAEEEDDHDFDSDLEFVRTLTFGTRVFCKYLGKPEEGLKLARRAREIFEGSKDGTLGGEGKKVEESRIERALGVALGALTAKEADVDTRPKRHAEALRHLEAAATLDPSSWETLYHLAYQLFELRQVDAALEHARRAVELNNANRDCWHLLGLLVAAQKDFAAALQVLETALEEENTGEGTSAASSVSASGAGSPDVPVVNVFTEDGNTPSDLTEVEEGLDALELDSALSFLPSGAAKPNALEFPRDDTEELISAVQIRMTKNVVIEAMEGPDAALLDQQALFAFFSRAFEGVRDEPDTPVRSAPAASTPETTVKKASSIMGRRRSVRSTAGTPEPQTTLSPTLTVPTRAPSALSSPTQQASYSTLSLNNGGDSNGGTAVETNSRSTKLLTDLWLLSAASYRRAGKLEEARGAIQEAETLNPDDPDVWAQYALYNLAISRQDVARTSVIKALAFVPTHIPSIVILSRLYLLSNVPSQIPFAEGLLQITKREGWDIPEAWFELSRCYKETGRKEKERECLVWALQLEQSRSVRGLGCLSRLL